MNKIILSGRLVKDVEILKSEKSGKNFVSLTLAVENFSNNEKTTYFIPCIAFGKTAELLNSYTKKGNKILIEGALTLTNYKDKKDEWRTKCNIIIERVEFLSSKAENTEPQSEKSDIKWKPQDMENDINF